MLQEAEILICITYINTSIIIYIWYIPEVIMERQNSSLIYKISFTALMAALCYAAFTYLKVPIPTPNGEHTALHVGNAICVLAALLLGGEYGGFAGSIGMSVADLMDPRYQTSAPKTFILKFCIGFIAGFIAHKIAHINEHDEKSYVFKWTLISSAVALGFNVIMDPLFGFFFNRYYLGMDVKAVSIIAKLSGLATTINAAVCVVVVVFVYTALRPALKKAGLFNIISGQITNKRISTVK